MGDSAGYPLAEALKAQQALREAANLPPEQFPVEAFVGMVSDEIEALRQLGKSDAEIARIIERSSVIRIDAETIAANFASAELRDWQTASDARSNREQGPAGRSEQGPGPWAAG